MAVMGLISLRYVAASFTETIKVARPWAGDMSGAFELPFRTSILDIGTGLQPLLHSSSLTWEILGALNCALSGQDSSCYACELVPQLRGCKPQASARWWLLGS